MRSSSAFWDSALASPAACSLLVGVSVAAALSPLVWWAARRLVAEHFVVQLICALVAGALIGAATILIAFIALLGFADSTGVDWQRLIPRFAPEATFVVIATSTQSATSTLFAYLTVSRRSSIQL